MPTFNGVDLFGSACTCVTVVNPRRRQVTRYPGVNGKVWKDMGSDGGTSVVAGEIYASTLPGLAAIEATINSIQASGAAGVFVDFYGNSYGNTILESFEPTDMIKPLSGGQGYARPFRCTFMHMS